MSAEGASAPVAGEHWAPGVNPFIIAMTVMLATFMEVLDTSVANVALPHIAGSLSAGVDESTWVLTSYLVSNAIVLPLSGWFGMIFGRKRFYMTCVVLFTISSALCGLAPNLPTLIFFRVLQGVGGGALQPISQAILVDSFPRSKQGMAMAVYGMGVVFAPIIGPTLGGWITDNFSWRWIFLINIPIGITSIMLTSILVEDPPHLIRKRLRDVHIDYIGLGLLSVGLGFLEVMLDKGEREDWFSSDLIRAAAVIAAVALVAFVWWELHHPEPVVELRLLKNRRFSTAMFTMFMLGAVLYSSTMLLPLLLQTLLGYTAMLSGMVLSPGGLGVAMLMPLVGYLIGRTQARFLIAFGLGLCSFGLYWMSQFNMEISFWNAVHARVVQSLGLAFLFVPINTVAFNVVARRRINQASGLINLARNIGGSTGIALVTTFLAQRMQVHQHTLVEHLTPYDQSFRIALGNLTHALMQQGDPSILATQKAYGMIYGTMSQQASMLAFNDCFRILAILFALMIPLALTMTTPKHEEH
ncbi:DHA2 family efflux MFS transporter permease subunit [bacterium]|nr:DHA2 family efflux MFS transporter permease subunit [bacterium]